MKNFLKPKKYHFFNLGSKIKINKNINIPSYIGNIVEILEPFAVKENRAIDTTKGMYFIISGSVELKRGNEFKELSEGGFLGEIEILFGDKRNVNAKAKIIPLGPKA